MFHIKKLDATEKTSLFDLLSPYLRQNLRRILKVFLIFTDQIKDKNKTLKKINLQTVKPAAIVVKARQYKNRISFYK